MTELERLVDFFEAEARGEEPEELTPEQIREQRRRDREEEEEDMRSRQQEPAVPPSTSAPTARASAAGGGTAAPSGATLLTRPPRMATTRKKKESKGSSFGLIVSIIIAAFAVYVPLHQSLSGLGLVFSAGAGSVVGVILVKSMIGGGNGSTSSRSKPENVERRVANGPTSRHRGEHDAVGNRTFPLRRARVQVLDVRVMEGSYATYRITVACQSQTWDVWHRYAEFNTLRHSLENSRVLPENVPRLPPKTFGHRFDQTFLIQRKEKLRAFMTALVQYPHICDRDDVRRFLLMPPLPQGEVVAAEAPYPGPPGSGWLRRLVGTPNVADARPPQISTEDANAGAEAQAQAGVEDPSSAAGDTYDEEPEEDGAVRLWKSPFKRSTIREILDEFSDAGPENEFVVRGQKYCNKDDADYKKKVKAGPALCELLHADIFAVDEEQYPEGRHFHIAARGIAAERVAFLQAMPSQPFLFIFNMQIPGDPPVSIVNYFGIPRSLLESVAIDEPLSPDATPEQKFYYMLKRFAAFDNTHPAPPEGEPELEGAGILPRSDWRNDRFKMIPKLLEAPWIVKNAVPVKPAIMGKKLTCRYFRGKDYVEVDLDVASEAIARNIVSLCRGYARQLVVDVGIVLQGENESELPERMLGVVSMHHIDLNFVMELH
eukprot:scaffold1070_cov245-Pinguiococcus_pyrenoidosus.AAC.25